MAVNYLPQGTSCPSHNYTLPLHAVFKVWKMNPAQTFLQFRINWQWSDMKMTPMTKWQKHFTVTMCECLFKIQWGILGTHNMSSVHCACWTEYSVRTLAEAVVLGGEGAAVGLGPADVSRLFIKHSLIQRTWPSPGVPATGPRSHSTESKWHLAGTKMKRKKKQHKGAEEEESGEEYWWISKESLLRVDRGGHVFVDVTECGCTGPWAQPRMEMVFLGSLGKHELRLHIVYVYRVVHAVYWLFDIWTEKQK